MIKLLDLLLEFSKGPKIGSGTEHDVYQDVNHNDRVLKCKKGQAIGNIVDWVELFKKYPKYFPQVYSADQECVEVDKLDTKRAQRDYEQIESALEDNIHRFVGTEDGWTLTMLLVNLVDNPKMLKQVLEVIRNKKPEYTDVFKKFFNLVEGVDKAMSGSKIKPDINKFAFGYAKDGSLKMVDV
jgi:hypothetical protein